MLVREIVTLVPVMIGVAVNAALRLSVTVSNAVMALVVKVTTEKVPAPEGVLRKLRSSVPSIA